MELLQAVDLSWINRKYYCRLTNSSLSEIASIAILLNSSLPYNILHLYSILYYIQYIQLYLQTRVTMKLQCYIRIILASQKEWNMHYMNELVNFFSSCDSFKRFKTSSTFVCCILNNVHFIILFNQQTVVLFSFFLTSSFAQILPS